MLDRVPVNPGRVLITPENGSAAYYATMTRADNATQEGTPLNKNSLLRDATASLFGLGTNAVPDDVFGVLSRFQNGLGNEYVWAKTSKSATIVRSVVDSETELRMWNLEASKYLNYTYSTGVSADESGNIVLEGIFVPTSLPSNSNINYWNGLIPFYINIDGSVYRINQSNSSSGNYVTISGFLQEVESKTVEANEVIGYVNSPNPSAYPIDDGYIYTALGQLGNKVQIATGSYTGTGTYGVSNPNSLTFDFTPKTVLFFAEATGTFAATNATHYPMILLWGITIQFGTSSSGTDNYSNVTYSGNTMTWYSLGVGGQFNVSGRTYRYVAIG